MKTRRYTKHHHFSIWCKFAPILSLGIIRYLILKDTFFATERLFSLQLRHWSYVHSGHFQILSLWHGDHTMQRRTGLSRFFRKRNFSRCHLPWRCEESSIHQCFFSLRPLRLGALYTWKWHAAPLHVPGSSDTPPPLCFARDFLCFL